LPPLDGSFIGNHKGRHICHLIKREIQFWKNIEMLERRKYPRKTVDLPVTVRLPLGRDQNARMADLSLGGMLFLCEDKPEINSEIDLCFTLPFFHISPDLRIVANVTHVVEVNVTPSTQPDYHYMVGVQFKNLLENDLATLDKFMNIDVASNRFE
jgi:c-di-GMP-binding flagellar brake protein YcgR